MSAVCLKFERKHPLPILISARVFRTESQLLVIRAENYFRNSLTTYSVNRYLNLLKVEGHTLEQYLQSALENITRPYLKMTRFYAHASACKEHAFLENKEFSARLSSRKLVHTDLAFLLYRHACIAGLQYSYLQYFTKDLGDKINALLEVLYEVVVTKYNFREYYPLITSDMLDNYFQNPCFMKLIAILIHANSNLLELDNFHLRNNTYPRFEDKVHQAVSDLFNSSTIGYLSMLK